LPEPDIQKLLDRHVKHQGFEDELEIERTALVLSVLPDDLRAMFLRRLAPLNFQAAVAQELFYKLKVSL
jgi:hypothetical protein